MISLPDNTASLKELVVDYAIENERLRQQVALLTNHLYGKTSEKSLKAQAFDEPDAPEAEEKEENKTSKGRQIGEAKKPKTRTLPRYLEREEKVYDLKPSEKQCHCGHPLHYMGDEILEQLKFIPESLKVIIHKRAKYACRHCEMGVKVARMPKQPIPKSMASPDLLARIITSKYQHHLPLYRQEAFFQQIGIELKRATLSNWTFKSAQLLEPVVKRLKELIINTHYVQADETTLKVLSEKSRQKCYMWVFLAPNLKGHRAVCFEYAASRSKAVPNSFLETFEGFLQTDGYSGYNDFTHKEDVVRLGCWAHARRKFFDIVKLSKKAGSAHTALSFIDELYRIEREAKKASYGADKIKQKRYEKSLPILKRFQEWLIKKAPQAPPKSPLGEAIKYTLNQWESLTVFTQEGHLEVDNNAVERCINPFACGRKNWLFSGNDKGAKASAILYSLIQSCKLNDINAYDYLTYVLTELPKREDLSNLDDLLPFNFGQ